MMTAFIRPSRMILVRNVRPQLSQQSSHYYNRYYSSTSSLRVQQQQQQQHPRHHRLAAYHYASPTHMFKAFGIPDEISDKLSFVLAGAMGATAALGMIAAVVASTTSSSPLPHHDSNASMPHRPPMTVASSASSSNNDLSYSSSSQNSSSSSSSMFNSSPTTKCDGAIPSTKDNHNHSNSTKVSPKLLRKKKTLVVANDAVTAANSSSFNDHQDNDKESQQDTSSPSSTNQTRLKTFLQRLSTKDEINKIRKHEQEILQRWERDEEGWRTLPARAWPPYQPTPEQLQNNIMVEIKLLGCSRHDDDRHKDDECTQLLFDMSTTLVFYNINPQLGLDTYRRLATNHDHIDSMVACGIVLVEGLGVPPQEQEGITWLRRAIDKDDNPQALYELATLYYTGLDGILEEDPVKAFELFERAANQDHTGALYMMADCLVEGEGCTKSVARAVPLFYKAAERGHRYSRQRIRELLARIDYPI